MSPPTEVQDKLMNQISTRYALSNLSELYIFSEFVYLTYTHYNLFRFPYSEPYYRNKHKELSVNIIHTKLFLFWFSVPYNSNSSKRNIILRKENIYIEFYLHILYRCIKVR